MRGVTAERIESNAFRILGLPGTASQQAIEQAARRMRIWPDEKRIPPTAWDLPWVGKLSRSKNALEQAVARLNEPTSRVEERLLWFHAASAMLKDQTPVSIQSIVPQLASSTNWAEKHDAALASYRAAMLLDPEMSDPRRWRSVVKTFGELAKSDDYLDYLLQVESTGDFGKRAEPDEVASAVVELPRSLLSGLSARGESALEDGRLDQVCNVARLLREIDKNSASKLLDRMEDLVQRRCEQLDDELRKNIVFSDTHRHSNEFVCRQARDAYVNTVEPVLNALDEFGKSEAHRAQRVRWACAKVLSMLGVGWIVAHHFVTAQETFEAALPMARGTALEKKLQEQIDENAHRVDYEQRRLDIAGSRRTKTYVVPASNVGGAPTEGRRMVPPNPGAGYGVVTAPRPKVRKPFFTFGEGNGRWGWALAVLVITVLRVLSSVSRDSDRNRNYTPPVPVRTFEQVDAQERLRIAQERNRAPQARPNAPRTSYDRTPAAEDPSRKKRAWEDVSPTGANSPYARQREPNEQRPTPSTPQRSPAAPRAPSAAPSGKR